MIYTIKSFLALLLATTILTMGNGLLNSLLSINMGLHGYSEQIIGFLVIYPVVGFPEWILEQAVQVLQSTTAK